MCRPSGASHHFDTGFPPLPRWATLFRPWRGWIQRKGRPHPYAAKVGHPRRQRQKQGKETRNGNGEVQEGSFAALKDDC